MATCTSPPEVGTSWDIVPDELMNLPFEGEPSVTEAERAALERWNLRHVAAVQLLRPGTPVENISFCRTGARIYDRPRDDTHRRVVESFTWSELKSASYRVSADEWRQLCGAVQPTVVPRSVDRLPLPRTLHHRRAHRAHGPPSSSSDDDPSPSALTFAIEVVSSVELFDTPAALTFAIRLARKLAWDGPVLSVELFDKLRKAGVPRRTAERAIGPQGLRMISDRDVYGGPVWRALPADGALTLSTTLLIRRMHRRKKYKVTTPSTYGDTASQHDVAHRQQVRIEKRSLTERGWSVDAEIRGDLSQAEWNYVSAVAHLARVEMDPRRRQSPRDLRAAILGEKAARDALPSGADVHRLRHLGEIEAGIGVAA